MCASRLKSVEVLLLHLLSYPREREKERERESCESHSHACDTMNEADVYLIVPGISGKQKSEKYTLTPPERDACLLMLVQQEIIT